GIDPGGWFEEDSVIYGEETSLWDAETGRLVATLEKQKHRIWSVAFSPHAHILASGRGDGAVRLWDTNTGGPLASLRSDREGVFSLAFSPDGYTLASGGWNGTIRFWSAITGRLKATSQVDAGAVYSVAFSLDSQILASASYDGTVRLWDVDTGQLQSILKGHSHWTQSVAFSPDGATLASASWDGTILLWDMSPYVTPILAPGPGEEMAPTASGLDAPAPNPFNITTLISYRLAAAGPVRLGIHNILGQEVYTLVDQFQGAGQYQVYWNGRDQRGGGVGSGVYFVRLQYPDGVKTRRLLHVK
ncbi:MAG: T9SS type A sorting domain-containing protein, partial [Gemmatimonadetes bacterium]|nr:T9SS type A sorting domain-containing protein [Gemmatimonadota bacterium]